MHSDGFDQLIDARPRGLADEFFGHEFETGHELVCRRPEWPRVNDARGHGHLIGRRFQPEVQDVAGTEVNVTDGAKAGVAEVMDDDGRFDGDERAADPPKHVDTGSTPLIRSPETRSQGHAELISRSVPGQTARDCTRLHSQRACPE